MQIGKALALTAALGAAGDPLIVYLEGDNIGFGSMDRATGDPKTAP